MNKQIEERTLYLVKTLDRLPPEQRLLVGICGVPGSGKTTFATLLVHRINTILGKQTAILVGMDGWHYSRAQLDKFENPAEAYRRRGAAFTFDGAAFVDCLKRLRRTTTTEIVYAPSFAHETKDPVPNSIAITPKHRIIIIEGIYLAMDELPWSEGVPLFNEVWHITVDPCVARQRIIDRHVKTGVTSDLKSAAERADTSDIPNGQYMLDRLLRIDHQIFSQNEPEIQKLAM